MNQKHQIAPESGWLNAQKAQSFGELYYTALYICKACANALGTYFTLIFHDIVHFK